MLEKRRVAIVEDEKAYRDLFSGYVKRYGEEHGVDMEITLFSDGLDLTEEYEAKWDIILLDIQMKHLDGFKTAKLIRRHDERTALIFITTLAQYAIKGYEVDAMDYMLKPVSYEQFALRFERAVRRTGKKEEQWLLVPGEDGTDRIPVSRIRYIDVDRHTLCIHLLSEKGEEKLYQMRKPIGKMEEELKGAPFYRCDQSVLVNLTHVTRVLKDAVVVGKATLPVSRSRRKGFLNALADFAG